MQQVYTIREVQDKLNIDYGLFRRFKRLGLITKVTRFLCTIDETFFKDFDVIAYRKKIRSEANRQTALSTWANSTKEQKALRVAKQKASLKAYYQSEEHAGEASQRLKLMWQTATQEWKDKRNKKLSDFAARYYSNPENREKISRQRKAAYEKAGGAIQAKIAETKKKRGTCSTSKPEKSAKAYLRKLGFYVEEEKPYPDEPNLHCDIYLPELDCWIELHFCQYHMGEPFDETNPEHLRKVKELSEKHKLSGKKKTQASIRIYCWTDLDIRKLSNVQRHDLTWFAFYSEYDFYLFVDTYLTWLAKPAYDFLI